MNQSSRGKRLRAGLVAFCFVLDACATAPVAADSGQPTMEAALGALSKAKAETT